MTVSFFDRPPKWLRPLLLLCAFLATFNARAAETLAGSFATMPLSKWIQSAGLKPSQVGLVVLPIGEVKPVVELNAQAPFNPASTMKILTTYAASALLGPEYRWKTSLFLSKPLQGDVLAGDLLVRGGGDPKLVIEDMQALVQKMRAMGLREIQGDLQIDASLYESGEKSVEIGFDGDPTQPYNVLPHAAMMNFKATNFIVSPGDAGLQLRTDPELADVEFDVRIKPVAGACRFGAAGLSVRDDGNPDKARVIVSGQYSVSCGEQGNYVSVLTHRQFIHGFFKAAWQAAGGVFHGQTKFTKLSRSTARPWLVWESPRNLAEVVRDINKFSNNVMARQVLLHLAADITKLPATQERARNTLNSWLRHKQFQFPELVVDNGSGLSRSERISALNLALVLKDIAASPYSNLMREALPVVGVDGTMRSRLRNDPIAGNAWIKTGTLTGVRAIAGFVRSVSGKDHIVVLLINGVGAEGSQSLQDSLLKWVHQQG